MGRYDVDTASKSDAENMKAKVHMNAVTIPISMVKAMALGTPLPGFGISSATCVVLRQGVSASLVVLLCAGIWWKGLRVYCQICVHAGAHSKQESCPVTPACLIVPVDEPRGRTFLLLAG